MMPLGEQTTLVLQTRNRGIGGATESWDFEIENAAAIPGLQSI